MLFLCLALGHIFAAILSPVVSIFQEFTDVSSLVHLRSVKLRMFFWSLCRHLQIDRVKYLWLWQLYLIFTLNTFNAEGCMVCTPSV